MIVRKGRFFLLSMPRAALITAAIAAVPCARASTNLLNVYIGAAYGHARLRARDIGLISSVSGSRLGGIDVGNSAYQVIAGVRALDFLGAEVDYFDLGSGGAAPTFSGVGPLPNVNAHVSQKGEAAFAVVYLPVPIIDVYLKAGVARLTTSLSATVTPSSAPLPLPCVTAVCPSLSEYRGAVRTTETAFAAGAGVQWKFGDWAIRGEYERFTALGEHPSLVSVGATWSFL